MRTNQTSLLELYNKGLPSWHVTRYLHSGRCTTFAAVVFCCLGECRVNKRYINHDLTITQIHPGKVNVEPKNGGLEDDFPFELDDS